MNETRENLMQAYAKATENIQRAERMGLRKFAQDARRDRKRIEAKLEKVA